MRLNGLQLPGVSVRAAAVEKYGIAGTQGQVTIHGAEEEEERGSTLPAPNTAGSIPQPIMTARR
jgi:hypothetical protein